MKFANKCFIGKNDLPINPKYFKEELISEILIIPKHKPDMERLLNVLVYPKVVSMKIVDTEVGMSNEGQNLTGYKLVVELRIQEKVTYVADEETQGVHAANYENMKSIFIVLPKEVNGKDTCELVRANRIAVTPYLEAVKSRMLDSRRIYKCIMLFVNAKIC